jgi:hypothetical protein
MDQTHPSHGRIQEGSDSNTMNKIHLSHGSVQKSSTFNTTMNLLTPCQTVSFLSILTVIYYSNSILPQRNRPVFGVKLIPISCNLEKTANKKFAVLSTSVPRNVA